MRKLRSLAFLAAVVALAACSPNKGRYLEIQSGGFLVDYRLAEVKAGFVARVRRTLPDDGELEATFQDPAGGPAIIIKHAVDPKAKEYAFTTPPISGVEKGKEYDVVLRVRDSAGKEVQRSEMSFVPEIDGSTVPTIRYSSDLRQY